MPPKVKGKGKGKGEGGKKDSPKKGNVEEEEKEIIVPVPVGIMTHRMRFLLQNSIKSDCEFLVGPEDSAVTIPAHKCVLSAESPVLSELLHREFVPPDPTTEATTKDSPPKDDGGKGKGKGKGKKAAKGKGGEGGKKDEEKGKGKGSPGKKGSPGNVAPLGTGGEAGTIDGCFSPDVQTSETQYRVPDVHPDGFYKLLRYLYHDEIVYNGVDGVLRTLYAARKYLIPILARACVEYLENNINLETVLRLLKASFFFHEDHLKALCMQFIINNTFDVVAREEFLKSELRMVDIILQQDILNIREIDLFSRVMNWAEKECERIGIFITGRNQRVALRLSMDLIRFPTMTPHEFACHVVPTEVLTHPEIITILSYFVTGHPPKVSFSCIKRRRPALAVDDIDKDTITFSDQSDITFVGNPHLDRRCNSMKDILVPIKPYTTKKEFVAYPRTRRASVQGEVEATDEIAEIVRENIVWYKKLYQDRVQFEYGKEHSVFVRSHWN